MPISQKLEKYIHVLNHVDTKEYSLSFKEKSLNTVKKPSCFVNFLRWFIHIITFTLVPLNANLDKVARRILKEINLQDKITNKEKRSFKTALINLRTILNENNAKKIFTTRINKFLSAINKVTQLKEIKHLNGKFAETKPVEPVELVDMDVKLSEEDVNIANTFICEVFKKNNQSPEWNGRYDKELIQIFNLIIRCKDPTLRSNLLKNISAQLVKFESSRFYEYLIFDLCKLSSEQKRKLNLGKYEIPLNLISAIKNRQLDLPDNIKIYKNMNKDQEALFFKILTIFNPKYNPKIYPYEECHDIHYFITWLEKLDPDSKRLENGIKQIYSTFPDDADESLIDLTGKLSPHSIKNYLLPNTDIIKNHHRIGSLVCEMIKVITPQVASDIIRRKWLSNKKFLNLKKLYQKNLILKNIDSAKILLGLIYEYFKGIKDIDLKKDYSLYFNYFEKYPWFLLLNFYDFDWAVIREWIANRDYPICNEIFKKYSYKGLHVNPQYFDELKQSKLNEKLQSFFSSAEENKFLEALRIYKKLEDPIRDYLLVVTRSTAAVFREELPYLNTAQLLVALLDEKSNKNMRKIITESLKDGSLSKEDVKPLIELAIKMQNTFDQDPEKSLLEDFLRHPIDMEGFFLNKCYNDPTYSDMAFNLGNETLHVHRGILSLDPELKKHILEKVGQTKEIKDPIEATAIKLKVKKLYDSQLRHLIIPKTQFKPLYNNNHSYSDYVLVCGKEEIKVHRSVLSAGLSFFEKLLGKKEWKEAQTGRMECDPEHFDALKAVVEYIYSGEMPDIAEDDQESLTAFKDALQIYNPK